MRLPGPGSVRVGRWVGRLGVVPLPAVAVGLDLQERVVRRHAARLQEAGWLGRAAGMWGEGSVVWMTERGLGAVGLGGLQAVRASSTPSPSLTTHGVLVGWSAARAQRRGHVWLSARELALERERWEVRVRGERGWRGVLPDLAVWPARGEMPIGLVIEAGFRRSWRQRAVLEGWRNAIRSGRYGGVRYDCAGEQTAHQITNLAEKVGLGRPVFLAVAQMTAAEIASIKPTPQPDEPVDPPPPPIDSHGQRFVDRRRRRSTATSNDRCDDEPVVESSPQPGPSGQDRPAISPLPEPPEAAAERERVIREVLGIPEPKPRPRWRR